MNKPVLGYTNNQNKYFSNLLCLKLNKNDMFSLGHVIDETKYKENSLSNTYRKLDSGVYIYKHEKFNNIGFRIYKEFADYGFNGYKDDYLISKLVDNQKNIHLTEFPIGIITINEQIVGQIIPLYIGYETLHDYSKKNKCLTFIFRRIVSIFVELSNNGIFYTDIHSRNIMVNKNTGDVKLIDFDYNQIRFHDNTCLNTMVNNIITMFKVLDDNSIIHETFIQWIYNEFYINIDKDKRKFKRA